MKITMPVIVRVFLSTMTVLIAFAIGERYSSSTAAQSRQKWDYQVIKADRIDGSGPGTMEIRGLKNLGEDGWEAVGLNDSWVLLKRSK